jgi:hypothetical protein
MGDKKFYERKGWGKDYWFATRKFKIQNWELKISELRWHCNIIKENASYHFKLVLISTINDKMH